MDNQGCPRLYVSFRLLQLCVCVCLTRLCVLARGNCVQCGTPLRKTNFHMQLFKDPAIDKEVEICKKVLKITRDFDFSSLREYNDYLEQVEEIVYNLTNNLEVEGTKHIMEAYQRENRDIIQKNKAKLVGTCNPALTRSALPDETHHLCIILLYYMISLPLPPSWLLCDHSPHTCIWMFPFRNALMSPPSCWHQHKDRTAQLETQIEKQKQVVKPTIFSTGIPMGQTVSCIEEVLYSYQPINSHTYRTPVPELKLLGRLG
uniref:MNAT1 component of CDK activating kinase n=1 Tax=Oncorhynchus kisutch TaxID=8019 RepID=A0A8C7KCW5_ONCKI